MKSKNLEKATKLVQCMNVDVTGCRSGDILKGCRPVTKNASQAIAMNSISVPPVGKCIDLIREFPQLESDFFTKLEAYDFFKNMLLIKSKDSKDSPITSKERRKIFGNWFDENKLDKDFDFSELGDQSGETIDTEGNEGNEGNEVTKDIDNDVDTDSTDSADSNDESKCVRTVFRDLGVMYGKMSEEVRDLVVGNCLSIQAIRSAFPGKEGSRARRHTLAFKSSNWKIENQYKIVRKYTGTVVNTCDGKISIGEDCDDSKSRLNQEIYLVGNVQKNEFKKHKIGILVPKSDSAFTVNKVRLIQLVDEFYDSQIDQGSIKMMKMTETERMEIQKIMSYMDSCMTPGFWKSILQKIIRFRSRRVIFPAFSMFLENDSKENKSYPTSYVLLLSFVYLACNPGSFVHDIQKYVTGLESALKRMFIIIFEDSYFDVNDDNVNDENVTKMFRLASCAMLAQRVRSWKPPRQYFLEWFQMLIAALEEDRCFDYEESQNDTEVKENKFYLTAKSSLLQCISAILDDMKSLSGDHLMIRYLVTKGIEKNNCLYSNDEKLKSCRPDYMDICHIIDQHCASDLIYFFPFDKLSTYLKNENATANASAKEFVTPFASLFRSLFDKITGYNPRRKGWCAEIKSKSNFYRRSFVKDVYRVQKSYLSRLLPNIYYSQENIVSVRSDISHISTVEEDSTFTLKYELHPSWLAGMIGDITVKVGRKDALAFLSVKDITEVLASHKPLVRNNKSQNVSDLCLSSTEYAKVIKEGKNLLKQGIKIQDCAVPIDEWKGMKVRWSATKNKYMITLPHYSDNDYDDNKTKKRDDRGKNKISWEKLRFVNVEFSYMADMVDNILDDDVDDIHSLLKINYQRQSIIGQNTLIMKNSVERFDIMLSKIVGKNVELLKDVYVHLRACKKKITFPRISREGGGTEILISYTIPFVFQFLLKCSLLFPAALQLDKKQPTTFNVGNSILLWFLRDKIKRFTSDIPSLKKDVEEKNTESKSPVIDCIDFLKDTKDTKDTSSRKRKIDFDCDEKLLSNTSTCLKKKKQNSTSWPSPNFRVNEFKHKIRKPWPHQLECCNEMIENYHGGENAFFIHMPTGQGKTLIMMNFLKYLNDEEKLPDYFIYSSPSTAITTVKNEFEYYNIQYEMIVPTGRKGDKKPIKLKKFKINIIEHDHLKHELLRKDLRRVAPKATFVLDESHKSLNRSTQRTEICLLIASLCKYFIRMTGTPVTDSKILKSKPYLELSVPFPVRNDNFMTSSSSAISRKADTGIIVERKDIHLEWNDSETKEKYQSLVPLQQGGTNTKFDRDDIIKAIELCYTAVTERMVSDTIEYLLLNTDTTYDADSTGITINNDSNDSKNRGVMIVAKDLGHQLLIQDALLKTGKILEEDIYVLKGKNSIDLTDESVTSGKVHDYKVVIVPISKPEGYSLTRLNLMLTSVYPSNQAKRTQIEGRLNRIGQASEKIEYRKLIIGILENISRNHNMAKSIEAAVESLAKTI